MRPFGRDHPVPKAYPVQLEPPPFLDSEVKHRQEHVDDLVGDQQAAEQPRQGETRGDHGEANGLARRGPG